MSSKEKKVKSSKGDDKKLGKKGDEVTIVVDRSNVESIVSPGAKTDPEFAGVDASKLNDALNGVAGDPNQGEENQETADDGKALTDATKLTEILVERYENCYIHCFFCFPMVIFSSLITDIPNCTYSKLILLIIVYFLTVARSDI